MLVNIDIYRIAEQHPHVLWIFEAMYPHAHVADHANTVSFYIARHYIGSLSSEKTMAMACVYLAIAKPRVKHFEISYRYVQDYCSSTSLPHCCVDSIVICG